MDYNPRQDSAFRFSEDCMLWNSAAGYALGDLVCEMGVIRECADHTSCNKIRPSESGSASVWGSLSTEGLETPPASR